MAVCGGELAGSCGEELRSGSVGRVWSGVEAGIREMMGRRMRVCVSGGRLLWRVSV